LTPLFANAAGKVMEWHRQRDTLASAVRYRPSYQPVQSNLAASQPLGDAHASPPPAVASTAASRTNSAEDTLAATATYPIPSVRCDTSSPAPVPPRTGNKGPSHTHSHSTAPPATLQQHPSDAINTSHSPAADISRAAQRTNSAEDTLARTSPTTRDTNIAKSFAPSNGSNHCLSQAPAFTPVSPEASNEGTSQLHAQSTARSSPKKPQQHPSDAINTSHSPAADISRAAQRTNSAEDTLARTSPTTRDTNIAKSFAPSNGSNHCLSQAPAFTPVSPEASNEGTSQLHAQSTARSSPNSRPTPLPRPQFTASSPNHAADIRACTPPLPASDGRDPASTTLDSISSITDLPLSAEAKIRMTLILIQDRHPELYASLKPESSTDKRRKQSRAAPQKQPNGSGRGGCHWS
jgi:hypothetical protein